MCEYKLLWIESNLLSPPYVGIYPLLTPDRIRGAGGCERESFWWVSEEAEGEADIGKDHYMLLCQDICPGEALTDLTNKRALTEGSKGLGGGPGRWRGKCDWDSYRLRECTGT